MFPCENAVVQAGGWGLGKRLRSSNYSGCGLDV